MRRFLLLCYFAPLCVFAQTLLYVDVATDSSPSTGGTFDSDTLTGDLRGVLNYINETSGSYDIIFDFTEATQITVSSTAPLPPVNLFSGNTLNFNYSDGTPGTATVTLDGDSTHRCLFVCQGTVGIYNMTFQNGVATGGSGGGGSYLAGGGGGLGAGGHHRRSRREHFSALE